MDLDAGALVTPTIRLVRELGAGGMGKVWLADHLALRSQVVVKFMSPELASRAEGRERFSLEASAASQMRSPHVVQVLDHGVTPAGLPYIVMEYLEGHDLRRHLETHGRIRPEDLRSIVAQIGKALGRAYKRGIVHRDIKPENIFLCEHGADELFVKVLDFGIAKTIDVKSGSATITGTVMGTAPYMSPEQLLGARTIDHRTDLWSLGIVVFEALTGELPFKGETAGALTLAIHRPEFPLPSERVASLGTAFDAWFSRACARTVEDRFASPAELAEAFSDAVDAYVQPPQRVVIEAASSADGTGPRSVTSARASRPIHPATDVEDAPTLQAAPRMMTAGTGTSQSATVLSTDRKSAGLGRWVALGAAGALAAFAIVFALSGPSTPAPAPSATAAPAGTPSARANATAMGAATELAPQLGMAAPEAIASSTAPSIAPSSSASASASASSTHPTSSFAAAPKGTTIKTTPKPSSTGSRNDASIF